MPGVFSGGNSKAISNRGYILAKLGRTDEAREVLKMLEAPSERYVPPYAAALVYAGLGLWESAMQALARAYDAHGVHLALLPVDSKMGCLSGRGWFHRPSGPLFLHEAITGRHSKLMTLSRSFPGEAHFAGLESDEPATKSTSLKPAFGPGRDTVAHQRPMARSHACARSRESVLGIIVLAGMAPMW